MDFRPVLRPDLGLVRGAGGEIIAVHDPLLDRRVNLGPLSQRVAALLDGQLGSTEIVARACALGHEAKDAEHALRTLLLLRLLDGAGGWVLDRARALKEGAPLPILIPEGTRFGCQGSGDCCRSYTLGPLTEEDQQRLLAREADLRAALPQLGDAPLFEERPGAEDGPPRRYLRTVQMRCLFLLPSERCGVHGTIGEAHKPGFCRLYPYQDLPTLLGRKIYDGGECASFGASARCGPFLEDDLDRVLSLLPKELEIQHPMVLLDDQTPCDYGHLLRLQEAMCARVLGAPFSEPPLQTLLALGRQLRRFVEGLRGCPIVAGEPERSLALAIAPAAEGADAEARLGEDPGAADPAALLALCADLRDEIAPSVALATYNVGFPFQSRLLQDLDEVLALFTDEALPAVAALPCAAAVTEAWRRSFAAQVFGRALLIADRPVPAFLRLATGFAVAKLRAGLLAKQRGAAELSIQDFNGGHRLAMRALSQGPLEKVFLRHEDHCWAALAALRARFS